MRVLLLDYSGTLSTLDDPVAFVEKLRAQGDHCILMSGHSPVHITENHPGLVEACHKYKSRVPLTEVVQELTNTHPIFEDPKGPLQGITEVVVVDDFRGNVNAANRCTVMFQRDHGFPSRGVLTEDIQTLLEPGN